jgi:hypothetical protein
MCCMCDAMPAGDDMMAAAVALLFTPPPERRRHRRRRHLCPRELEARDANEKRDECVQRERWMSACRGRSDWRWLETMKLMSASVKRGRRCGDNKGLVHATARQDQVISPHHPSHHCTYACYRHSEYRRSFRRPIPKTSSHSFGH